MKTIRFLTISLFVVLYALPAVACLYPWCSCPIVTGQVSPIEADGSFRVWVERTDYPNNLSFTVHFRGGSSNYPLGDSRYITLWADCMTEPSELRIVPNDCGFNPYLPGEWVTTIGATANLKPTVSLTVDKAFDPAENRMRSKATVTWDLGLYTNAWDLRVDALPWKNADGHVYAGYVLWSPDPVTRTGTDEFFFDTPSTAQQFTILAVAQSCTGRATQEVSADCSPCDETASKDPVYFNDGNVRVTDGDPLPPIGGHRLVRTYNSDEQVIAPFGRGWTTPFDQRLIVNDDGGEEIVSIVTGTNEVVTFRGGPGAYRQTWPSRRTASGTLSYDSTAQTYAYRVPGSSEVAVFRTSDGRLIELGDRQTGRAATIEYSPEGLPATFTDSWTETEWEITSDTARRLVTSIVVSGRPELKWTYAYDGSGNLTSIEAPGPTPWRSYVYAGNRLIASYDGAGHLIESHDYDATGYGVSSTGPSDEILNIEYNVATANPNERITPGDREERKRDRLRARPVGRFLAYGAYRGRLRELRHARVEPGSGSERTHHPEAECRRLRHGQRLYRRPADLYDDRNEARGM